MLTISSLLKSKSISLLDYHFAQFIEKVSGEENPELALAAALLSHYREKGNTCLDLSMLAGKPFHNEEEEEVYPYPDLSHWMEKIKNCPAVGHSEDFVPIITDNTRLYLHRYWHYEKSLAESIRERVQSGMEDVDFAILKNSLSRMFPEKERQKTDWQKVAAFTAVTRNFCVISGGPGTGKTTTVVKILAILLELFENQKLNIALAAPTGKAAARLQESISNAKNHLSCPDVIKNLLPEEVSTIHRLLGTKPDTPYFRHNAKNPLPCDVLVLDEASLVDLALMSKLFTALKPQSRVILLGDRDQLASVEAGAVLADICGERETEIFSKDFSEKWKSMDFESVPMKQSLGKFSPLNDSIIELRENFRFKAESGIGSLSVAIKKGEAASALHILKNERHEGLAWKELPPPKSLPQYLGEKIISTFEKVLNAKNYSEAFIYLQQFRILCALKNGPFGVVSVNLLAEKALKKAGLIKTDTDWYHGRPIMVTRNDYSLNLFNGDTGMVLPDPGPEKKLLAFFPGPDGSFKKFLPQVLPEHETVFAMTVHKSQGSEFDQVLLLLPDKSSPVLTRELVYTGITRAKGSVEIWGKEDVFQKAVKNRVERMSGLRDALWGELPVVEI